MELEYPQFSGDRDDILHLNLLTRAHAVSQLLRFRRVVLVEMGERDPFSSLSSSLAASYEVSIYTDSLVSIRHTYFAYLSGAAHPSHTTQVANYQRGPLISLSLRAIFDVGEPFLKAVSEYCIRTLTKESGDSPVSEWIQQGAGPKIENYEKFNLTDRGLLVTFDEYQVGPYSEGGKQVQIPGALLANYVRQGSPAGALFHS